MTSMVQARDELAAFVAAKVDGSPISTLGLDLDSHFVFDAEGDAPGADLSAWIRVTIQHRGREQQTLGRPRQRRFRVDGAILFSIFVLREATPAFRTAFRTAYKEATEADYPTGTEPNSPIIAGWLVEQIFLAFESSSGQKIPITSGNLKRAREENDAGTLVDFDRNFPIEIGWPSSREGGVDGSWWRTTVEIPFAYEQYA